MNISEVFIRRRVGTLLLALGVIFVGINSYFALPVAPPAAGRVPDHPGVRQPARRQRRHHGHVGRDTARALALERSGHHADDFVELARRLANYAAVRSEPLHRRSRAGRADRDQRGRRPAPQEPAQSTHVQKDESRRSHGAHTRPDIGHPATDRDRPLCRGLHRATDLADARRGARGLSRPTAPRRARATRSRQGGATRAHSRRRARHHRRPDRQRAQGQPDRATPGSRPRRHRPGDDRRWL